MDLQFCSFLCVDYRANCVKKKCKCSKFSFKIFLLFFKKKTICTSVDSIRNLDKLQQNQDP